MCEFCNFDDKSNKSRILGETDRKKGLNMKAWMRPVNEIGFMASMDDIQGYDVTVRYIKINYCPMCGRSLKGDDANV